ncbi:hypothetical protein B0H16DRAFT_1837699 [Mycena metata]|uniref:Uncharacterized protein n=1 Tax=Mycena metata TaxID=1033252 RepID=A0AAD7GJP3_9AGAR|nr:hypothetical protein B0H16DRAFT_1837699 [Mycena metata]
MAAETGPRRSLVFPFELSTIGYLSTTTSPPARPYIPALRACAMWSLYCSFLASVERLLTLYATAKDNSSRAELRNAVHLEQKDRSLKHMLATAFFPLAHTRQTPHHLLDSTPCFKLDIFNKFLVDSVISESEPYNSIETIEILRPDRILVISDPSALRECLRTLRAIVHRTKNEAVGINDIDRALGVYLPLFDTLVDPEMENSVADALITYLNGRQHPGAVLHVLHQCDVARIWFRVTRRLTRADRPDDVLTAVCAPASCSSTRVLPPVSQYSTSVAAMLRTVALHAAETVRLPIFTNNKDTTTSFAALQYLWTSPLLPSSPTAPLVSTPVADTSKTSTDPPSPLDPDAHQLRSLLTNARLALLTQFIADCASSSSPAPYNALPTLSHLGAASPLIADIPPAPDLETQTQTRFAQQLWAFVGLANEPLLQAVLECPLVSGLRWLESHHDNGYGNGATGRAMRRAMDKAWLLGMQLPIVRETLERLPLVEAGDTPPELEGIEIVDDGADIRSAPGEVQDRRRLKLWICSAMYQKRVSALLTLYTT